MCSDCHGKGIPCSNFRKTLCLEVPSTCPGRTDATPPKPLLQATFRRSSPYLTSRSDLGLVLAPLSSSLSHQSNPTANPVSFLKNICRICPTSAATRFWSQAGSPLILADLLSSTRAGPRKRAWHVVGAACSRADSVLAKSSQLRTWTASLGSCLCKWKGQVWASSPRHHHHQNLLSDNSYLISPQVAPHSPSSRGSGVFKRLSPAPLHPAAQAGQFQACCTLPDFHWHSLSQGQSLDSRCPRDLWDLLAHRWVTTLTSAWLGAEAKGWGAVPSTHWVSFNCLKGCGQTRLQDPRKNAE